MSVMLNQNYSNNNVIEAKADIGAGLSSGKHLIEQQVGPVVIILMCKELRGNSGLKKWI